VGTLALGSWIVLVTALLPGLVADPTEFVFYHWLIFASALLGLAGGVLWARSHRRWRSVVAAAAGLYLLVVLVRFMAVSVWWQLDYGSFLEALRFALWFKSRLLAHHFVQGRLFEGIGITYYEALMPALQLIVLLGLTATHHRARQGPVAGARPR
jgi:hypothetical protein